MKIIVTFGELIDRGVWMEVCEMKGINKWCMNEGLANSLDELSLELEEAIKLGLVSKNNP